MADGGKEKRQYFFISGLPRSGSTLLCNVLAQNPRFHVTSTSGIIHILVNVRNIWDSFPEFKTMSEEKSEASKARVMRGILDTYFADAERPVVFDKSRGWLAWMELAEVILGDKPKVLVPVRDLREVYASFEKMYRETTSTRQLPQEQQNFLAMRTVAGRYQLLSGQDAVVGNAVMNIRDALYRGWGQQMHFIDYDRFTNNPKGTLRDIYDFLGEDQFTHDFDHVEQVTQEDDLVWVWKNLHKIRPKIEPQAPQAKKYLPKALRESLKADSRFWEEVLKELKEVD